MIMTKRLFKDFLLFDRWYNNSTMTEYIIKLNTIIEFDSDEGIVKLYTSLMFRSDNDNIQTIRIAYDNMSNVINGDKQ